MGKKGQRGIDQNGLAQQRCRAMREAQAEATAEWVARLFRANGWRVFAPNEDRAMYDDACRTRGHVLEVRELDAAGVLVTAFRLEAYREPPNVVEESSPHRWPL